MSCTMSASTTHSLLSAGSLPAGHVVRQRLHKWAIETMSLPYASGSHNIRSLVCRRPARRTRRSPAAVHIPIKNASFRGI